MMRRPPRSTPLYSSAASDVYKRQVLLQILVLPLQPAKLLFLRHQAALAGERIGRMFLQLPTPFPQNADIDPKIPRHLRELSLIHISEPTRLRRISYAVFC